MRVTVGICTWNRAALLDRTLAEMESLEIPSDVDWELLVVNNHCTDETDRVLEKYSQSLPLRRLFEPRQGLSHARNCLMDSAQGDLLIWTDDDVLADPTWLSTYVGAAKAWSEAAFFGGVVRPWFGQSPPGWIERNLDILMSAYAIKDLGPETRILEAGESVFGANMAFRRSKLGGLRFDSRLGCVGEGRIGGDETQFIRQLILRGHFGLWVGQACVRHYISPNRLTSQYVKSYYLDHGRSLVRLDKVKGHPIVGGAPAWAWRNYLIALARSLMLAPFRTRAWLLSLRQAATTRGMILEWSEPPDRSAPETSATG